MTFGIAVLGARLSDELKANYVVVRFRSPFGRPPHLHERRYRHRSIENREVATYERGRLKGTCTENAGAPVAHILNAAVKLLRCAGRRPGREQTAGMHIQHLRETLVLASILAWKVRHSVASCLKTPLR